MSPALEAKIIAVTQQAPPPPFTHWSVRRLAQRLAVSPATVHRVWQRAGLKPHRLERYTVSSDPEFERKAADIIGLYLQPPAHAAVFCVGEKTAIQALDRRDPLLPLSPGRAERHGFEYVRHGALSPYAALDVGTGRIEARTAVRHTSSEFLTFLDHLVATQPKRRALHLIVDNFSAHKTKAGQAWLAAHPSVTLHMDRASQGHHERGLPPVDPLEQIVQRENHEDETGLADELARDALPAPPGD